MRKKKQREEEMAKAAVGPADSCGIGDPLSSDDTARDFHGAQSSEPECSTSMIVRPASPRATTSSTPVTNGNGKGVLRRLSRTASPPPSPSDSEDSDIGSTSMIRTAPPTHPRSFSLSSSSSSSTSTTTAPHRLPPSSTYRPGSSYVPPSIPPSVRPLPSGPRALRAGLGIGVGVGNGAGAGVVQAAGAPLRGFQQAQFVGVPRGPSADRDRDRGWASTVRGRGRGTTSSSSWGR